MDLRDFANMELPDNGYGRRLWDAALEGLAPFKPRRVNVFLDYDIDRNKKRLGVEAYFEDCFFPVHLYINELEMYINPHIEIDRLSRLIVEELRFRPRVPSDHNLGEE